MNVKWRIVRAAVLAACLGVLLVPTATTPATYASRAEKFVATWSTSPQGPYPVGFSVGQPGPIGPAGPGNTAPLLVFAFPDNQAHDQTLREIVHLSLGGNVFRFRLSNVFGSNPVTFGDVRVGVQALGARIVPGTNRQLTFGGRNFVTVPAGQEVFSDPLHMKFSDSEARDRNLAISLFVRGASGPMTWHAAAFTTSFISNPRAGDRTADISESDFPNSTTSWFFMDGVEVQREHTSVVVAFGDSITDGFFSTLNEDDRWPDDLARRLQAREGDSAFSVINEAIGGNTVTRLPRVGGGCTPCDGPPAVDRLDRDVLDQAGVRFVVWLEGINDLGGSNATADQVIAGMRDVIQRVHARGIKIIGATLTPSEGTAFGLYGTPETDAKRRQINDFIRHGGAFDAVVDFDAVTDDPNNPGHFLPQFDTESTVGGPGDHLHPNRAGFQAMAGAFDLSVFSRSQ